MIWIDVCICDWVKEWDYNLSRFCLHWYVSHVQHITIHLSGFESQTRRYKKKTIFAKTSKKHSHTHTHSSVTNQCPYTILARWIRPSQTYWVLILIRLYLTYRLNAHVFVKYAYAKHTIYNIYNHPFYVNPIFFRHISCTFALSRSSFNRTSWHGMAWWCVRVKSTNAITTCSYLFYHNSCPPPQYIVRFHLVCFFFYRFSQNKCETIESVYGIGGADFGIVAK